MKPITIVLSTRNPSKAEQVQKLFVGTKIKILTLDDVGIQGEAVEDGKTLRENSLKKAIFAWRKLNDDAKTGVMADDTGLFIRALNGAPGIHASRWAGENATTDEITEFTLNRLKGVEDRFAFFETVVTLISPSGHTSYFTSMVGGNILEAARTKPQLKMPYSSIFVPEGEKRVWAEMTTEEENAISNRGRAFRQVRDFFQA